MTGRKGACSEMSVIRLDEIRRHPVKGFGPELLPSVALTAGHALPGDRIFALATAKGAADARDGDGGWVRCRNFVRPTTDPRLAQVEQLYDDETGWLMARHPSLPRITVDLSGETGGPALCDWAEELVSPGVLPLTVFKAAPHQGAAAHYADTETPAVSIMSAASLDDLSTAAGRPLQRERFRGNLWIKGAEPWAERDWVGKRVRIGAVEVDILEEIVRCASPGADPETGERNVDVVGLLDRHIGDSVFGVLARVATDGTVSERDVLTVL